MSRLTPKIVRKRFLVAAGHALHLTWPVLSIILAFQVALGLLIGFLEGWSFGDAVYFTYVCPVRPFCVKHFTADATEDGYKSCRSHAIDFRAL
jgi:hypothetical protein